MSKKPHGLYDPPWVVAMRKAPLASLCIDDDCDLSGNRAHVGPCERCSCPYAHAIEECPERRTDGCRACNGQGYHPCLNCSGQGRVAAHPEHASTQMPSLAECGAYLGDNDGTCPQLTCIRVKGHNGAHDNVCGDDEAGPVAPEAAGQLERCFSCNGRGTPYPGGPTCGACKGTGQAWRATPSSGVTPDRESRWLDENIGGGEYSAAVLGELVTLLASVRREAIEACAKVCEAVEDRNKNAEGLKLWPVRECIARVRALLSVSQEGTKR